MLTVTTNQKLQKVGSVGPSCFLAAIGIALLVGLQGCSNDATSSQPNVSVTPQSPEMPGAVTNDAGLQLNPVIYELLMKELSRSMEKWKDLDNYHKTQAIKAGLLALKARQNATIQKPAEFYMQRMDEMIGQGGNLPDNLLTALTVLAIMEYDYDIGQDKDQLAKSALGAQLYEANKQRRAALQQPNK